MKKNKSLVLKVGSSSLVGEDGRVHEDFVNRISGELKKLKKAGWDVIIVSSGAIALGRILYKGPLRRSLSQKQALSAIGQRFLVNLWEAGLSPQGILTSQILLTREDFKSRERMLNFRNILRELLAMGSIPIINENDALSSSEIRVGDNDTLGALVAAAAEASHYVIMSDIDGLYDKNPSLYADGRLIPQVDAITQEIRDMAGGTGSKVGTGGMVTKLQSAEIVTRAGITMHIVNHHMQDFAAKLMAGSSMGTEFMAHDTLSPHMHWVGFTSRSAGRLTIDEGALQAIRSRKSLLAVGITGVEGYIKPGDTVEIYGPSGNIVARGLSNFSGSQIFLIMGKQNSLHAEILQEEVHSTVVHANNMILTEEE